MDEKEVKALHAEIGEWIAGAPDDFLSEKQLHSLIWTLAMDQDIFTRLSVQVIAERRANKVAMEADLNDLG